MTLLLTGIALGVLFNPATGPDTRRWLRDKILRAGRAVRVPVERAVEHLLLAEPEHPAPAGWPGRIRAIRTDHYPFCWGCGLDVGGLGFDWTLTGQRLEARHVFPESSRARRGSCTAASSPPSSTRRVARWHDSQPRRPSRAASRFDISRLFLSIRSPGRGRDRRVGGRSAIAEATIQDDSGFLLAHARAECVQVRPEYFLSTPQGKAHGEPTGFLLGGLDETQQCRRAARPGRFGFTRPAQVFAPTGF